MKSGTARQRRAVRSRFLELALAADLAGFSRLKFRLERVRQANGALTRGRRLSVARMVAARVRVHVARVHAMTAEDVF